MEEKTLIALEIGSSKIKGAVGTLDASGMLNVKMVEEERICDIVRHGCIRNVVDTATAVRSVLDRIETRLAPRKIQKVYLSIGGRSLRSDVISQERRLPQEAEITRDIIKEIYDGALSSAIPDRTVVSVSPREVLVDGSAAPRPVGMIGSNVVARLNLITCRTQLLRNLSRVIEERLGLRIMDTFARPLAEADLVLTPEEKRLGCMLVDFGAETTTVAIYRNGVLMHLASIPLGSRNITRDIMDLNHVEERAEELKIKGGSASQDSGMTAAGSEYAAVNNYVVARAGEIIANIVQQIEYAGLSADRLPEGIVIIGRGARLNGFNDRLERESGLKVRTGTVGNKVRISEGRVSGTDAVDVISILSEAVKNSPVECLSPKPEIPARVEMPVSEPAKPAGPAVAAPAPGVGVKPPVIKPVAEKPAAEEKYAKPEPESIWARTMAALRNRVATLIGDNLYENEEE